MSNNITYRVILFLFVSYTTSVFATSPIDFNTDASNNIDARIATKHSFENKPIYAIQKHSSGTYIRSLDCWASDIDLTCCSPYNSREEGKRAGTLITLRHCILAAHYNLLKGDSIRFVTMDNKTVRRKIIGSIITNSGSAAVPDICVVTLDSDVPNSITPCKFLPGNYSSYILNDGKNLPALLVDQEEKALVADFSVISTSRNFSLKYPTLANRLALSEQVITGDSGNPIFIILNGKPVLIGCFTWGGAGAGNALTYYANMATGGTLPEVSINDFIALADVSAGINTGYKISYFDFNTTSLTKLDYTKIANIKVNERNISIEPLEFGASFSVKITDVLGKVIINQVNVHSSLNLELPTGGIYIVKIQKGDSKQIFKIILP